jgi:dTDP-4-amino-4,6-dideoxygalactose transaminase
VLYTGAEVRFADVISADELTVSPEDIERQITDRTRAVIVMHYAGFPCRMPEILEIASRHGLAVIEDAAHAPGASLHGRALGTWGDAGCFSFFSNKNLATGEGGMLVTDRDDIAEKARLLRSHAMTSLTWDRHQGHAYSYDVVDLGYNYRTDEIRASLGRVQLTRLPANNNKRAEITARYWRELSGSGLGLPFKQIAGDAHIRPAYHIMPVMLPAGIARQAFIDQLRQAGIQTSIHYPPIHRFSYHRQRYPGSELPQTELVASREVTLPLYPGMLEAQLDLVIDSVSSALDTRGR